MIPASVVTISVERPRRSERPLRWAGRARGVCMRALLFCGAPWSRAARGHRLRRRSMIRLAAPALTIDECRDGPDRREDEEGEPHVRVLPWRLEDSAERDRKRRDDVDEPEPPNAVPAQRPLAEDLEVVLHAGSNTLGRPGANEPGADRN